MNVYLNVHVPLNITEIHGMKKTMVGLRMLCVNFWATETSNTEMCFFHHFFH